MPTKCNAVVTDKGKVIELFRNAPDAGTRLRNTGPLGVQHQPGSVRPQVLHGQSGCQLPRPLAQHRGGDKPHRPSLGKISWMEQRLPARGVPLPVR
jgi:hypothetical protein